MKKKMLTMTTLAGINYLAWHLAPKSLKAIVCGNFNKFSPMTVTLNPNSPLYGKKIAFLGSSITYGFAAKGDSFVEYLQARDGVQPTKSAISGTTLAGHEHDTYVSRIVRDFDTEQNFDAFVCQLSTNDSRQNKKVGIITPDNQKSDFDTETTLGAIEYICQYVRENFDCPLIFYTCLRKSRPGYDKLVEKLFELQKKWHFRIIDLYHDTVVKDLCDKSPWAMFDDAHPTRLGYKTIWTPVFEHELAKVVK